MAEERIAFALVDGRDNIMFATVRRQRKDVPRAAEEWCGYSMEKWRDHGYRIAKVRLSVVEPQGERP